MELKKQVGKAIKDLRKGRGYTMQSFADLLGVDRVSVTRYESGKKNLSTSTLERIASALGVTVSVIFENR